MPLYADAASIGRALDWVLLPVIDNTGFKNSSLQNSGIYSLTGLRGGGQGRARCDDIHPAGVAGGPGGGLGPYLAPGEKVTRSTPGTFDQPTLWC